MFGSKNINKKPAVNRIADPTASQQTVYYLTIVAKYTSSCFRNIGF